MKPGDLICYNAGGMKYKTLGLVIEIHKSFETVDVLIMWGVVGDLMPRKSFGRGLNTHIEFNSKIHSGDIVWHQTGNWFEVINESR